MMQVMTAPVIIDLDSQQNVVRLRMAAACSIIPHALRPSRALASWAFVGRRDYPSRLISPLRLGIARCSPRSIDLPGSVSSVAWRGCSKHPARRRACPEAGYTGEGRRNPERPPHSGDRAFSSDKASRFGFPVGLVIGPSAAAQRHVQPLFVSSHVPFTHSTKPSRSSSLIRSVMRTSTVIPRGRG